MRDRLSQLHPDADPVVYFIQSGDDGPIKIGFCNTREGVNKRLADLQCANPMKLHLRRVVPGFMSYERELHRRFAQWRLEGEWFLATVEVAGEANAPDMKRLNPLRGLAPLLDRAFKAGHDLGQLKGQRMFLDDFVCEMEAIALRMKQGVEAGEVEAAETLGRELLAALKAKAA